MSDEPWKFFTCNVAAAKHKSDIEFTKDTPYLALTVELQGVCCEDLGNNWPRYNGTCPEAKLHHKIVISMYRLEGESFW